MPNRHPHPISARRSSLRRLKFLLLGIFLLFQPQSESRAFVVRLNRENRAPVYKNAEAAEAAARAEAEAKWREAEAKRQAKAAVVAGAPLVLAPDLGIPADEVFLNPTRRWIRANITAPWIAEMKQRPDAKDYEQDIYEFEDLFLHHFRGIDPPNNKKSLEKRFIERAKKNPNDVWFAFAAQAVPLLRTPNSQHANETERYKRLRAAFDKLPPATTAENAARRVFAGQILLTYAPRIERTYNAEEKLKSWMREELNNTAQEFFRNLESAAIHGFFRSEDGEIFLFHLITFRKHAKLIEYPLIWKKQELLAVFKSDSTSVSEWCLELMAGYMEHKHAWKEWGRGLVWKSEDLEKLAKHRGIAYEHYKRADKLNPKNPIAAANLISIATQFPDVSKETPRYWFDRATSISGNYDSAYGKYAYSLSPEQGGSTKELQALLKTCVSMKNPDGLERINIIREILR